MELLASNSDSLPLGLRLIRNVSRASGCAPADLDALIGEVSDFWHSREFSGFGAIGIVDNVECPVPLLDFLVRFALGPGALVGKIFEDWPLVVSRLESFAVSLSSAILSLLYFLRRFGFLSAILSDCWG